MVYCVMQYITGGPDIPDEIEHALRNNELVLFCGAGISVQKGLPTFKKLVKQVCKKLGIDIKTTPILNEAWKRKHYDKVLDLVEGNESFSVSREDLRKAVINILEKRKSKEVQDEKGKKSTRNNHKGKSDIHKALLDLSALPGNKGHRLVTTNFDRLFFEAGLKRALSDSAPKLAPPKKETWKNLTFLHGVIDEKHDPEGDNLILTEKDFGRAYLHDNWATRFVIQLFQDFTVLFIGYGLNDPMMKYLVRAISDENKRRKQNDYKTNATYESTNKNRNVDKTTPSIYAFAGYTGGEQEQAKNKWRTIGVEPISYYIKNNKDHSTLYNTIKKWAKRKATGLADKKHWLKEELKSSYQDSDKRKERNIISSLKEDNKLAEYLPQIDYASESKKENEPKQNKPVDISWLKPMSKRGLLDKLIKRTARPIQSAPQMPLWETLSPTECHIANWLLHHLDKKELVHWVIDQGCILHPNFKQMIRWEIEYKAKNQNNIHTLKKRALLFWATVANNSYLAYQSIREYDIYGAIRDLNEQYCVIKAQKLLEALKPYIHFNKIHIPDSYLKENLELEDTIVYGAKLKVNTRHHPHVKLKKDAKVLLLHAEDFSNLLKKAMDLAKLFEIIKNGEDNFYIIKPSIEQYTQNTTDNPWTYLIDLVRDSFDLTIQQDRDLAICLLNKWRLYPYSIFYRLIFYAITKYPELEEDIALNLLESKPAHTLWSITSQNEVFKYLKHRKHSTEAIKKLCSLIKEGPSRNLFKKDIDESIFIECKEKDIYERLDYLKEGRASLPEEINIYYNKIQKKYSLKPSQSKEDDFHTETAVWRGSQKRYHNLAPKQIYNLLKDPKSTLWPGDKERKFRSVVTDDIDKAFKALLMFSDQDMESALYWGAFLSGITEINDTQKSNEYFKKALKKIENQNDEFMDKCLKSLIFAWDFKAGSIYSTDKQYFEKWWKRLWNLSIKDKKDFTLDDSNFSPDALNSKLGKLSKSIFQALWSKFDKTIPKNSKIPEEIKRYFNTIIKTGAKVNPAVMFHFGSDLYQLWFLDREWTKKNIKILMDWENNKDISGALWEGYTYQMKVSADFLSDFKTKFYKLFLNAKNLYKIGSENYDDKNRCFAVAELFFITTGGKWFTNIFTKKETTKLKPVLDIDLLECLSEKIWRLLKDSGDKSSNLWIDTLKPWMDQFWPYRKDKKTPRIAENLSVVILYCGDKLPDAFTLLESKIEKIIKKNHYFIIDHIAESIENNPKRLDHVFNYPQELLQILNWNLPESNTLDDYYGEELRNILDKLKNKHPKIEQDEKYTALLDKIP